MSDETTKMKEFISFSDIISLLNMSSGFLSIICSINHNFWLAAILMIIAIMFDSMDGWVARKTNRQDDLGFGKNIDSLSDIVSFGVSPAIFIYTYINTTPGIFQAIVILTSLLIVICGVLRLTRYNAISDKVKGFIGFPIPGIAIIMATYYLSGLFNIYIALILAIIVSIAMICNKSYEKFDNLYLLILNTLCLLCIVFQIPINIGFVNGAALIVLLTSLTYLFINLIKG